MTRSSSFSLWVYSALIFIGSNSLGVTHWKLDTKSSKVVPVEKSSKHLAAGESYLEDNPNENPDSQLENDAIIPTLIQRYNSFEAVPGSSTEEPKYIEIPVPSIDDGCIGSLCKNDPNLIIPESVLKETILNTEYTLSDPAKDEKMKTPNRNDISSEFKSNKKTEKLSNDKKVEEKPWTPPNT